MSPPSPEATSSANEDRIRRNVACVNCRNSKVRCRAAQKSGEPCQRCTKLRLPCVVDKHHKRITKKSKLEQIEEELKSIKKAVHITNSSDGHDHSRSPSRTVISTSLSDQQSLPSVAQLVSGPGSILSSGTPIASSLRPAKGCPSQPRSLKGVMVSGVDIEFYFDKFLECFHPFIPILRKKDPDECFQANETLFWVIIYISCRRYVKREDLFTLLVDSLSKDIWVLLSNPILSLEAIHALLLMCAYPLPTIRFATDPSTMFAGIAMNVCMLMGLHTGDGANREFCVGARLDMTATNEEASCTWIMTCVLAQRSASSSGHPPPSIQLNDAPCKRALAAPEWTTLLIMFDVQKFLNRLHLAMASYITTNGSVDETTVSSWEADFESVKAGLAHLRSDLSQYIFLSAQQEIQNYYFSYPPSKPGPNFPLNALRSFTTSHNIITALSTSTFNSRPILFHAPHFIFRTVVDAGCIILSTLTSNAIPPNLPGPPEQLHRQAREAVAACSIREGDLPFRGAAIHEAFWNARSILPRLDVPVGAWPNRLGAGVTFWCLQRFNRLLTDVKKNSENTNRSAEIPEPMQSNGLTQAGEQPLQQPFAPADPMQDIDWSIFMDDFGWGADAVFMGLS